MCPRCSCPSCWRRRSERGLFISVPKIKAHRYSVVSLGIKGMQGTVMRSEATPAYNQKWRMHEELKAYLGQRKRNEPEDRAMYVASLELFAERMVDVLEISLPDVVLVEGVPAMSGDGFQNIRKVPGGIAIGGTNPVLVDRVGAEYLGLWNNAELAKELGGHRTSPLIEVAAQSLRRAAWPNQSSPGTAWRRSRRRGPVFFKAIAPFSLPADASADCPRQARLRRLLTSTATSSQSGRARPPSPGRPTSAVPHTAIRTTARFLWTEGALFAAFELAGAGLNVDASRPITIERAKLYEEDCVELFFGSGPGAS